MWKQSFAVRISVSWNTGILGEDPDGDHTFSCEFYGAESGDLPGRGA